ncbi:MAG: hypothetical protein ACYDCI_05750 [Candidatus Limnocylindrales bacterium]
MSKVANLVDPFAGPAITIAAAAGDIGAGGVVTGIGGVPIVGAPADGQVMYYDGTQWLPASAVQSGTHAARPAAASTNTNWIYYETDTSQLFVSNGSAWQALSVSSVTLAGDVTGPSGANTVVKINGSPLGTLTPATADRLRWNGSAWVNSALRWTPLTAYDPTTAHYLPLVAGDGSTIMAEV